MNIDEAIRMQNKIIEQYNIIGKMASFPVDRGLVEYANTLRKAASFQVEPETMRGMVDLYNYFYNNAASFEGIFAAQQAIAPVLESYQSVTNIANTIQKVQESIQPINSFLQGIQYAIPETNFISQLAEISNSMLLKPSALLGLQTAIEAQINSSLWEYDIDNFDIDDENVQEMQEDILILTESEDKEEVLKSFLAKWGATGKNILISVIKWLIITFLAGLVNYWSEPIYKILTPSFLLQEENNDCENKVTIPINTELHVWNSITNNYIEVTYELDGMEYSGYMEQQEFKNNTRKISDEIGLEHIVFVDSVTQMLSVKWNTQPDIVYSFLKDTGLVNDYILKYYEVLNLLDEAELVDNIEKYCVKQQIRNPFLESQE